MRKHKPPLHQFICSISLSFVHLCHEIIQMFVSFYDLFPAFFLRFLRRPSLQCSVLTRNSLVKSPLLGHDDMNDMASSLVPGMFTG